MDKILYFSINLFLHKIILVMEIKTNYNYGGCIFKYVFKAIKYRDHGHYHDDNENDGVAHIRVGYRKGFDTTNENTYFIIQVNLISNVIAVYTEAVSNNCQVRKEFLQVLSL